jgi:hypothetical protein
MACVLTQVMERSNAPRDSVLALRTRIFERAISLIPKGQSLAPKSMMSAAILLTRTGIQNENRSLVESTVRRTLERVAKPSPESLRAIHPLLNELVTAGFTSEAEAIWERIKPIVATNTNVRYDKQSIGELYADWLKVEARDQPRQIP